MTKENHIAHKVIDRLDRLQRKIITVSKTMPSQSILIPAESHGSDIERFQDTTQSLLSWRNKQTQTWQFCGYLKTHSQRPFGVQFTFKEYNNNNSRIGVLPTRWIKPKTYFADLSFIDPLSSNPSHTSQAWKMGGFFSKGGFSSESKLHIELDGCFITQLQNHLSVYLNHSNHSFYLQAKELKPLVFHGQAGYLQKDILSHEASYSCSFPLLKLEGQCLFDEKLHNVSGYGFLDHEKFTYEEEKIEFNHSWDKIFLQLSSHEELFLNLRYDEYQRINHYSMGSYINSQGSIQHFISSDIKIEDLEYWVSPVTKKKYPVKQKLTLIPLGVSFETKPILPDQETARGLATSKLPPKLRKRFTHESWRGWLTAKSAQGDAMGFMNSYRIGHL